MEWMVETFVRVSVAMQTREAWVQWAFGKRIRGVKRGMGRK